MAQGPNEARFRTSLNGASPESVQDGAKEWLRCAELLDVVSRSLVAAADKDKDIGGRTGPAMGAAFRRTSKSVDERAGLLREGKAALESAAQVIEKAAKARDAMDKAHPAGTNPGSWNRPVGPLTEEDLDAQRKHQAKVNEYQENAAARERISQQWTQNIDNVFADSTEVMKKIHGEPDPEPPKKTGEGKPGSINPTKGIPQGPGESDPRDPDHDDPRDPDHDDPRDPDHDDPRDPDHDDPGDPDDHNDPGDPGDPGDPENLPPIGSDPGGNSGGVGTGTLGGLAAGAGGGALALGGLRNGGLALPGGAVNSNGVRPIGSSGRIGTSGPLGRGAGGGAIAPGSPVGRGGAGAGRGAAGVGRGAAGTGSPVGRGGRGGPGGRGAAGRGGRGAGAGRGVGAGRGAGAGGIGTGRGKGKKDDEKKQAARDLFDDGQDWIDDEGAAPDVLN
ncbi:MAG TPA: hypothetical protein VNQ53_17990 [Nocardioides sp.]|nr:hypothetical protein [Nocardioides sp.]